MPCLGCCAADRQSYRVSGTALECCLWMLQERELGGFKADVEEEFEDKEGNVYDRRTYEDLKRQGIL